MSTASSFTARRPEDLLRCISESFPHLKWRAYQYIDEGWDHQIIILDNKIVFRFPIAKGYTETLRLEVEVLDYLNNLGLPAKIPAYSFKPKGLAFAGYALVPGVNLTKQLFDQLDVGTVSTISGQLAEFLSAIHTQPISPPLNRLPREPLDEDMQEVSVGVKKHLAPTLDGGDLQLTYQILEEVSKLSGLPLPETLIHNDIYSRHLLWENPIKQLGIIDFSDMGIGDPAIDFAELHEYGFDFVGSVYKNYKGPKDDTFLDRAWTYQKWIGVYMMVDYFISGKTTFEAARETFDRIKNQEKDRAPTAV